MGFFSKIKEGLTKTRKAMEDTLSNVFSGFSSLDDDFYDELEEKLILSDMGMDTTLKAVEELKRRVKSEKLKDEEEDTYQPGRFKEDYDRYQDYGSESDFAQAGFTMKETSDDDDLSVAINENDTADQDDSYGDED